MQTLIHRLLGDRAFYAKLLNIAIPIIIQNFIMSSLNLVDVIMIGQVGDVAVAAVGLGNQVYFLLRLLLFGITSGAAVFAAQYWGKRDIPNIRKVLGLSLMLACFSGLFFTVIALVLPGWILGLYSEDTRVIQEGVVYLRIVGISYLATAISFAYSDVLRSTENVRLPMAVSVIALSMNIILDYGLILGRLGMPQMGIEGAAIGTTLSRFVEMILLLIFTYRKDTPAAARLHEMLGQSREFLRSFAVTASPVIANELLWSLGSTMYVVIYAHISTTALAAANIASTVQSMGLVFLIGISSACAIIVGNQIGAGQEETAYHYAKRSLVINVIFALLLGAGLHFLSAPILQLYSVTEETAYTAIRMIRMIGYIFWLKSIAMVLIVGIMRSGGDTRYSMVIDVGAIWLVGIPLGALAAFVFHVPAYWVTLIIASEDIAKNIIGLKRFVSKKWINNLVRETT